jgi:hypothetical protein
MRLTKNFIANGKKGTQKEKYFSVNFFLHSTYLAYM